MPLPGPIGSLGEELRSDIPIQNSMLADAIGGWRGIIDSSLPSLVFVIAYLTTSQNLTISIWCALGAGAVIALTCLRGFEYRAVAVGWRGRRSGDGRHDGLAQRPATQAGLLHRDLVVGRNVCPQARSAIALVLCRTRGSARYRQDRHGLAIDVNRWLDHLSPGEAGAGRLPPASTRT